MFQAALSMQKVRRFKPHIENACHVPRSSTKLCIRAVLDSSKVTYLISVLMHNFVAFAGLDILTPMGAVASLLVHLKIEQCSERFMSGHAFAAYHGMPTGVLLNDALCTSHGRAILNCIFGHRVQYQRDFSSECAGSRSSRGGYKARFPGLTQADYHILLSGHAGCKFT